MGRLGAGFEVLRFRLERGGAAAALNDVDCTGAVAGSSDTACGGSADGPPTASEGKRSGSSSAETIAAEMPELDVMTEMKESLMR